ncbi:hypothetical protein cypCar_00000636 [Cyprinus carpio]|nr:hypothetical protein cypCar_00000636 [Cyprinus carpio]
MEHTGIEEVNQTHQQHEPISFGIDQILNGSDQPSSCMLPSRTCDPDYALAPNVYANGYNSVYNPACSMAAGLAGSYNVNMNMNVSMKTLLFTFRTRRIRSIVPETEHSTESEKAAARRSSRLQNLQSWRTLHRHQIVPGVRASSATARPTALKDDRRSGQNLVSEQKNKMEVSENKFDLE